MTQLGAGVPGCGCLSPLAKAWARYVIITQVVAVLKYVMAEFMPDRCFSLLVLQLGVLP